MTDDQNRTGPTALPPSAALSSAVAAQAQEQATAQATQERRLLHALAALEHDGWARYMRYFLARLTPGPHLGALTIPADYVAALRRQVAAPYAALTYSEQREDITEAARALPLIRAYVAGVTAGIRGAARDLYAALEVVADTPYEAASWGTATEAAARYEATEAALAMARETDTASEAFGEMATLHATIAVARALVDEAVTACRREGRDASEWERLRVVLGRVRTFTTGAPATSGSGASGEGVTH